MPELSEAYVVGLLAELEREVPRLESELAAARGRAERIEAELGRLLCRREDASAALAAHEHRAEDAAALVATHNGRLASLHRESAALTRKADDYKREMSRAGDGPVHGRLRRERATFLVQIEDCQQEVAGLQSAIERARRELAAAEAGITEERDKMRAVTSELDRLQSQLPRPQAYLTLFAGRAARAHCRLYLDHDRLAWERELRGATALVAEIHRELRAGKYRLDKDSDVLAGRATASAEALYAAASIGDVLRAQELFGLMVDPGLRFEHIFNVFRVWCLGLYIAGEHGELARLLERHPFSPGLRGGYVEAFEGLLRHDERRFGAGIQAICRYEWQMWQDPTLPSGAGVVCLGATGLARLALEVGLRVVSPGPTVPADMLAGLRSAGTRA